MIKCTPMKKKYISTYEAPFMKRNFIKVLLKDKY